METSWAAWPWRLSEELLAGLNLQDPDVGYSKVWEPSSPAPNTHRRTSLIKKRPTERGKGSEI